MKTTIQYISILMFSLLSSAVGAGQIASIPLFVATQVVPNVFFEIDDSGSMDWTILSKQYYGPCAYDPDAGDQIDNSTDATTCGGLKKNGLMYSFGSK